MNSFLNPSPGALLFVCSGNICRSPTAEGVFMHLAQQQGAETRFLVESCGTGGWHEGEPADSRTRQTALRRGVSLEQHRARKIQPSDFERFDLLVAMDRGHLAELQRLGRGKPAQIVLLRDFDPLEPGDDVPDPYYGGPSGFEDVYDLILRCCQQLLDKLTADSSGRG